jgi:hypothetical protein
MEDGGWRMEDGGWRMEDGGWRMEDGGWRIALTLMPEEGSRVLARMVLTLGCYEFRISCPDRIVENVRF